jgi:hypothetical protein
LVALIVLPQLAVSVRGCICYPLGSPYKTYQEAKAVFVGKVLSSKDVAAQEQLRDKSYTYFERRFRFSITESLKGTTNTEIEISAGRIDSDCYQGFTVGETYLVYAYGDSPDALGSGACTRTNNLKYASDDLYYLHALLKGMPEPRVYGSVSRIDNDVTRATSARVVPMEGVKILIEGEGRKFEAVTNKDGLYSINKVPDGRYKAKPQLSDKYRTYFPAEEEFVLGTTPEYNYPRVQQGTAAYASFQIGWNNSLSGRILDAEGNPIVRAKASVMIARGSSPVLIQEDEYDHHPAGKYDFRGLTPGKYLLSVKIRAPFTDSNRPSRFYFPYVENVSQATELTIGENESLERDIRLPPGYLVRQIEGTLVWPNGVSVSGGWVFLAATKDTPEDGEKFDWTMTDELGRFSLQAFVGQEYWVHGSSNSSGKGEPSKIKVSKANEPLKVVIPFPKPAGP